MMRKRKVQVIKSILKLIRNTFRIICLIIFLWWIAWLVSYANCVNYYEAIKDEKVTKHDEETEKYQCFSGWFNKPEKKTIAQIEEEVLSQIEAKKSVKCERIWEKEKLTEFNQDSQKIKELADKKDQSPEKKKELEKKSEDYQKKFQKAREETIKNIQAELEKNDLSITELDDKRSWWKKILFDPLKFFLVSPLNQASKLLGMHRANQGFFVFLLEIIFKLAVIEILFLWVSYSETKTFWENSEKIRNPYLSVEEKEQLAAETSPLTKYLIFNGFMVALFNFFLSIHPALFNKTSQLFCEKTNWIVWVPFFLISFLASSLSVEFLQQGRLLNFQEIKNSFAKNLVMNLALVSFMLWLLWFVGMNSFGQHLVIFLGGLVKLAISIVRVKFFHHKEHLPRRRVWKH